MLGQLLVLAVRQVVQDGAQIAPQQIGVDVGVDLSQLVFIVLTTVFQAADKCAQDAAVLGMAFNRLSTVRAGRAINSRLMATRFVDASGLQDQIHQRGVRVEIPIRRLITLVHVVEVPHLQASHLSGKLGLSGFPCGTYEVRP